LRVQSITLLHFSGGGFVCLGRCEAHAGVLLFVNGGSLANVRINIVHLLVEFGEFLLAFRVNVGRTLEIPLESLQNGLTFSQITRFRHLRTLVHRVVTQHVKVSLLFEFVSLVRYVKLLGDNSPAFGAIFGGVVDLGLERNLLD